MAQLIKLRDYVSRYEFNPYHYPSQYIRLKQENWDKLYQIWDTQDDKGRDGLPDEEELSTFSKLKSFIKQDNEPKPGKEDDILPESELELKQYFLDKLFPFQLKWATSTVTDVSFVDKEYHYDATLRYLLQRFPDIYFVMYYPIFNIKQAPIDAEIILISPIGIEIICLLEDRPEATFMAGDDRTWTMEVENDETKIISPLIALKRTEHIIKSILNTKEIDFPILKSVISRTNNIVFSSEPYQTNIIGKFQFDKWFSKKRQLSSTLKSQQLKVIETLLGFCQTTSVKRPEWEEDTTIF